MLEFLLIIIFFMSVTAVYLKIQVSKLKDDRYFYKMEYLRIRNGGKDDVLERMDKGFLSIKYREEILEGGKALKDYKKFTNQKDISSTK